MNQIKISQFSLAYHRQEKVIHPLDITICPGDRIGIIGESGAGKSTLVRSIFNNLLEVVQTQGFILSDTTPLYQNSKWNMNILKRWWGKVVTFIAQEPIASLAPDYTIQQQLEDILKFQGISKEHIEESSKKFLNLAAFPYLRRHAIPCQLSGGENQRASLALAMAANPKILVADEPTTGLDLLVEKQIIQTLQYILEKNPGMALLMVTHSLGVLNQILQNGGKVLVFHQGYLVDQFQTFAGRPLVSHIYNPSRHPYTIKLLQDYIQQEENVKKEKNSPNINLEKQRNIMYAENILLEAQNFSTGYDAQTILKDFNYTIRENQHVAIIGETGSGKTTLAKGLSNLLSPNQWIKGTLRRWHNGNYYDVTSIPSSKLCEYHNLNQLVWQNPSDVFSPSENVRDILFDACLVWSNLQKIFESKKHIEQRIEKVMKDLLLLGQDTLSQFFQRYPQHLSGGQRKRLLLARSLLACGYGYSDWQKEKPARILFIDEPMRGIDVSNKKIIMKFLKNISEEVRATLVIITHDLQLAHYFCQDIIVLYRGEIVEMGPISQIMDDNFQPVGDISKHHPYTLDLLAAIPNITSFWGNLATGTDAM